MYFCGKKKPLVVMRSTNDGEAKLHEVN